MAQTFRQPKILDIARREGRVTVERLAGHFGVTLQTIRRDLAELAEAGRLERVHGGAILPSGTHNIGYEERRGLNQAAKTAIGQACAAHLPDDCSIFLNIGTTTEAVAARLLHHRNILVVTNNMNVALILADNPACQVVLTGGTLRRSDGGLVGPQTIDAIRSFRFDQRGLAGLFDDGPADADHSKLSRSAPARIGSLADVDRIVTDRPLPDGLARACRAWGAEVVLTPP